MDEYQGWLPLCAKVRVTLPRELRSRVGICHCLDCRKHHGALFYAAAIFPRDAVADQTGMPAVTPGGSFCPRSADPRSLPITGDEVEVHLGQF